MDNMQADALRRAREMHTNANVPKKGEPFMPPSQRIERVIQTEQSSSFVPPSLKDERSAHTEQREVISHSNSNPSVTCGDSFINEGALFADKEKMLILSLILILCTEEKSDPALTLALLYLII